MNKVLSFFRKILNNLYYAFFVLSTGALNYGFPNFDASKMSDWIATIIAFAFYGLLYSLAGHWFGPYGIICFIFMALALNYGLDKLLYRYYSPVHEEIEERYKKDNRLTKILYGLLAIVLSLAAIRAGVEIITMR